MRWIGIAVLACVMPTGSMAQTPLHRLKPEPPQWSRKPSGDDMARVFPDPARAMSGWAVLICRTSEVGMLEGCQTMAEAPAGVGFGDAALKLSPLFKLDPKKMAPGELINGFIELPLIFNAPQGAPLPPRDYAVGGGAVLLSVLPAGTAKGIPCATQAAPTQKCAAHAITWNKRPEDTVAIVRTATTTPETTGMLCGVRKDLQLDDCEVLGAAEPAQIDAMDKLVSGLVAKPQTEDKTDVAGGRVFVPFNWRTLKRVAEAQAAFKTAP